MRAVGLGLSLAISGCFPAPHLEHDVADAAVTTDTSTVEIAVPQTCTQDDQCAGLTVAPCTVGQCGHGTCTAASVAVTCDDGDPCTTADRCAAGVCAGRAFTADDAKNWAFVATPTGDGYLHFNNVVVHPSGEVSVVARLQGEVDLGPLVGKRSGDGGHPFYLRFNTSGGVRQAISLFGNAPSRSSLAHTVFARGEDALVVAAVSAATGQRIVSTILVRVSETGAIGLESAAIPGAIISAIPAGPDELFVVSDVSEDAAITTRAGVPVTQHVQGPNDLYVARVREDGGIVWLKTWTSVTTDAGPALIAAGGDLLFSATTAFGDGTAVSANFDGLPLDASEMAATLRIPMDGSQSVVSAIPQSARSMVLGGYPAGDGDVIATTLAPIDAAQSLPPTVDAALSRFFPGGAAVRWSVPFSGPFGRFPVPIELPNADILLVWPLESTEGVTGWPGTLPASSRATLLGVWSPNGRIRSTLALDGVVAAGAVPKGNASFVLGHETAAVAPDGAIYLVAESQGASLGPDFGGVATSANSGVLVRYSPARVYGCVTESH